MFWALLSPALQLEWKIREWEETYIYPAGSLILDT